MAIHSLRAVDPTIANHVIAQLKQADARFPIHIHVAEQQAEVEACLAAHGKRSIEFLMDCYDCRCQLVFDPRHAVPVVELHAIDRSHANRRRLSNHGSESREGNFVGKELATLSRRIAIGSDSHCSIDVREELRWLEYTQRLQHRERAVMGTAPRRVGRSRGCIKRVLEREAKRLGCAQVDYEPGYRADFVILDLDHPSQGDVTGIGCSIATSFAITLTRIAR